MAPVTLSADFSPRNRDALFTIAAAALVFAVHLAMSLPLSGPWQATDETTFLANARFLSAVSIMPNLADATFYPGGYSLFLVPAFWISSHQAQVYHAALAINALLATAQFLAVFAILRSALHVPHRRATLIALVVAAYPAYLLQSNIAWSENAFPLVMSLAILALNRLLRDGKAIHGALFCALASYSYAVHGRALLVPFVAIAAVLALVAMRRVRPHAGAVAVCTGLLVFAFDKYLESVLLRNGYETAAGSYGAQLSSGISRAAGFFLASPGEFTWRLVHGWAGTLWYMVACTLGLAAIGGVHLARLATAGWRAHGSDESGHAPDPFLAVCIIALCAAVFVVSAGLPDGQPAPLARADHLFYGRYNEGFLFLPLAIGLSSLAEAPRGMRAALQNCGVAALVAVAALALLMIGVSAEMWDKGVYYPTVWGFTAYLMAPIPIHLAPAVATLATLASLVLFALARRRFAFTAIYAFALFALFASVGYRGYVARDLGARYRLAAESILEHVPAGTKFVSYNFEEQEWFTFHLLQYWFRNQRFEDYSPSKGQKPHHPLVISRMKPDSAIPLRPYRIAYLESFIWVPASDASPGQASPDDALIVTSSPFNGQAPPSKLVDGKNGSWIDAWMSAPLAPDNTDAWVEFTFPAARHCGQYTVIAVNHDPVRYPTGWILKGDTGSGWHVLGEVRDQKFRKAEQKRFDCNGGDRLFYRLRFEFSGREPGQDRVAVGEIVFD